MSEYDASRGRSVPCGHRIIVSDEMIGQLVECEKCKQQLEVPFEVAKKSAPQAGAATKKQKPAVAATKSTRNSHKKKSVRVKKINELGLAAPVERIPTDVMTFEFEQDQIASVYDSIDKRCPKCGNLLEENGNCSKCKYVEPKFSSAYLPLDNIHMQLAGFQKWFCAIFNEGVSIRLIEIGLHVMLGILALILALSAILVGGWVGAVAIGIILVCFALYVGFIYKGHQLASNPRAKLAWFQIPPWNLILWFARKLNWQAYDSSLKGRAMIEIRHEAIVDEKIPHLEGLSKCHVLDLEGSLVTDKGLRHLYGLKNLHCLVLRKSQVTHEGVLRLQQANPQLWIWY